MELPLSPENAALAASQPGSGYAPEGGRPGERGQNFYISDVQVDSDEESEPESDDDHEGMGSGDLKNAGQMLWIRGLSRLQTQVHSLLICYCSACYYFSVLCYFGQLTFPANFFNFACFP